MVAIPYKKFRHDQDSGVQVIFEFLSLTLESPIHGPKCHFFGEGT